MINYFRFSLKFFLLLTEAIVVIYSTFIHLTSNQASFHHATVVILHDLIKIVPEFW